SQYSRPLTMSASSFYIIPPPPTSTLFPYTTLFRSLLHRIVTGRLVERIPPERKIVRPDWCATEVEIAPFGREQRLQHVLPALLRSEEHTSELQSRGHLVCRLLLEKKK